MSSSSSSSSKQQSQRTSQGLLRVRAPASSAVAPAATADGGLQGILGNAACLSGLVSGEAAALTAWGSQAMGVGMAADPFSSNQAMMRLMRAEQAGALPPEGAARLEALLATSSGAPLPPAVAARMAAVLGHDFSGVRVHTDAAAAGAAHAIAARAFALGRDLYFAPGLFRPGTPAGDHLIAHELTHVIQHDEGRLSSAPQGVSHPHDPAEREAEARASEACADLLLLQAPLPDSMTAPAPQVEGAATAAAVSAGEAPMMRSATPEEEGEKGEGEEEGGMLAMVRAFAPELAVLLERGVEEVYGGPMSSLLEGQMASIAQGLIGFDPSMFVSAGPLVEIAETVAGAATGDPRCCKAFEGWLSAFQAMGEGWLESTWTAQVFSAAQEGMPKLLAGIGGVLSGGAELLYRSFQREIDALLGGVVRAILAVAAWDQQLAGWIAGMLGLEGLEDGGMLALCGRLWESCVAGVKALYEGVLSGLAEVLMAIPLVEKAYRVIDAVLDVTEGVAWLYENWGDPLLVQKAHREMGHSWVPRFLESGEQVQMALGKLVGLLQGEGLALLDRMDEAARRAGEEPILRGLATLLADTVVGLHGVIESPLWPKLAEGMAAFATFAGDVMAAWIDVLVGVAACSDSPTALLRLLTGEAFLLLPDCYKTALFDALLPYAAAMADLMLPGVLMLGGPAGMLLLPLVHPAVLGAVQAATTRSDADKARLLEGLARFLSGAHSIAFLQGFGVGFVAGIGQQIGDTISLLLTLQRLGTGFARLCANLPAAFLSAVAGAALDGLVLTAEGLDALGDRHFQEDEYTKPPEVPSPQEGQDVAAGSEALQGEVATVSADFSSLPRLMHGLWATLVVALQAQAMAGMDLLLDQLLRLEEAPDTLGRAVGGVAAQVFGEVLLTKGATTLAAQAPRLLALVDELVLLIQTPDLLQGALTSGLRKLSTLGLDLMGSIAADLRGLQMPALSKLLDLLDALFRRLGGLADHLEKRLGWTEGKEEVDPVALQRALDAGPAALVDLVRAAQALGDDEILSIAQEALVRVHRDQSQSLLDTASRYIGEELDDLRDPLKALQPESYDPNRSAEENLREHLIAVASEALTEGAEDDAEVSHVAELVQAARRLPPEILPALAAVAAAGRDAGVQRLALAFLTHAVEEIVRSGTLVYDEGLHQEKKSAAENLCRHLIDVARRALV